MSLEVAVKPRSPLRLPRRGSPDGTLRARDGVLSRLLHVGGAPVVVHAWQLRDGEVRLRAEGASKAALEKAIERMRFALGVDDDLSGFYQAFKKDPLIGRTIRAKPWIRPRRRPWAWEALLWAITAQLIESGRAAAIQRRMLGRWGIRSAGMKDLPPPGVVAGLAPAELAACDLAPKRALAMIKVAREVAAGRADPASAETDARLLAIPEIGPWTVQMLALGGRGEPDALPAGDLAFVKLVGRLTGVGRATVEEVEEYFAPYEPYRGLAGSFALMTKGVTGSGPAAARWSPGPRASVAAG